jgi:hypothetical protein
MTVLKIIFWDWCSVGLNQYLVCKLSDHLFNFRFFWLIIFIVKLDKVKYINYISNKLKASVLSLYIEDLFPKKCNFIYTLRRCCTWTCLWRHKMETYWSQSSIGFCPLLIVIFSSLCKKINWMLKIERFNSNWITWTGYIYLFVSCLVYIYKKIMFHLLGKLQIHVPFIKTKHSFGSYQFIWAASQQNQNITSRETNSEQHESWSDFADAQAGLDPCRLQMHYVGFVVARLICS